MHGIGERISTGEKHVEEVSCTITSCIENLYMCGNPIM